MNQLHRALPMIARHLQRYLPAPTPTPHFAAQLARHQRRGQVDAKVVNIVARFGRHFDDVDTLNNELGSTSANASILIKGSRFMKMERVVERLTGISVGGH